MLSNQQPIDSGAAWQFGYEMKPGANAGINNSSNGRDDDSDDEDRPLQGAYHDADRDGEWEEREKAELRAQEREVAERGERAMVWLVIKCTAAVAVYAVGSVLWFQVLDREDRKRSEERRVGKECPV